MVLPSQHLFIIIIWLMYDFRMRDDCDSFPMTASNYCNEVTAISHFWCKAKEMLR